MNSPRKVDHSFDDVLSHPQVHDIFYPFIQTNDDEITFLWVNESKTGFCHLYKVTSLLQQGCYQWARDYTHSEGMPSSSDPGLAFTSLHL